MTLSVVIPLPGTGLVARAGELLLVVADEPGADALLQVFATAAADGVDGNTLVRRAVAVLVDDEEGRLPACALGGPSQGRFAVLVYGDATAEVTGAGGPVRLSGAEAITAVSRFVPGPVTAVRLLLPGVDAGSADARLHLAGGVVAGAGLAVSEPAAGQPAPMPAAAMPAAAMPAAAMAPAAMAPAAMAPSAMEPAVREPVARGAAAPTPVTAPPAPPATPMPPPTPMPPATPMPPPTPMQPAAPLAPVASAHAVAPVQPVVTPPQPAQLQPVAPAAPVAPAPPVAPVLAVPQPAAPPQEYSVVPPGGPYPAPPPFPPVPPAAPAEPPAAQPGPPAPPAIPSLPRVPDAAKPFDSVILLPGAAAPAPPVPAAPVDPRPMVLGVLCKNDHFNDPDLRYCQVCGISMAQQTLIKHEGPRPPLGVLLFDDGMTFRLDIDYLVGREPANDPTVVAGTARPLRVVDPQNQVSRVHLRVALVGWQVQLVDQSANGTYLRLPGQDAPTRVNRGQAVPLKPGAQIYLGQRWFRYESHRNP